MLKTFLTITLTALPWVASAATNVSLKDVSTIDPTLESEEFGTDVMGAGDVNGDGYEDMLVGAPEAGEDGEGHVYLFYGRAEKMATLTTNDAIVFSGEEESDHLGSVVAALGDINNDGFADFAATSRYHDTNFQNPGTIYLFYGQAAAFTNQTVEHRTRFYGVATRDSAGTAVAGVGDINLDGYDDFVITAPDNHSANKGAIYLMYGRATSFAETEDLDDYVSFVGEHNYDYLGSALAGGDVNGDGYSDLLVSSIRYDNNGKDAGKVYVIPGRSTLYTDTTIAGFTGVVGTTRSEKIGNSIAVANVTGDGIKDIIIAAEESDAATEHGGAVYIVPGSTTVPNNASISSAIAVTSNVLSELAGASVSNLGDIDADGYEDLLVGAPSELQPETGKAYVLMGSTSLASHNITADFTLTGDEQSSLAGQEVSATDFNGDGIQDLLIAAPLYGADAGRVYLGYWPIHTCANSAEVGGILVNYPLTDWKYRKYAENSQYKIVVERKGKIAQVVNCYTDTIVQTLTFNTRAQRKILARVFRGRQDHLFVAVTRTFSKRKMKLFLYQQTPTQLELADTIIQRWRPRGLRIKLKKRNHITLQKGKERKHRKHYLLEPEFTLTQL